MVLQVWPKMSVISLPLEPLCSVPPPCAMNLTSVPTFLPSLFQRPSLCSRYSLCLPPPSAIHPLGPHTNPHFPTILLRFPMIEKVSTSSNSALIITHRALFLYLTSLLDGKCLKGKGCCLLLFPFTLQHSVSQQVMPKRSGWENPCCRNVPGFTGYLVYLLPHTSWQ